MTSSGEDKLAGLRSEIDARDLKILRMLEERLSLSEEVSKAKSGDTAFRPGREADLIVNLMKQSQLPPRLVEHIWRGIIGQSLASQHRLKIAHGEDFTIVAATQFRFGGKYHFHLSNNASDIVDKVASGEVDLGVVPHWDDDSSWIATLGQHRQKDNEVYIASQTYLVTGHAYRQSVIIAPFLPDPSSHDRTIVVNEREVQMIDGHHEDAEGCFGMIQVIDAKKVGGK